MLSKDDNVLRQQAQHLAQAGRGEVISATSRVGGGALPLLELPGPAAAIATRDPDALAARLRAGDPPVLARIADGRVVLDPRTLAEDEIPVAAAALRSAAGPDTIN
jgi:L-seryl-tRNA(Ser) seleniumtransferase